jgi:uncharacterized protein with HEPN domain
MFLLTGCQSTPEEPKEKRFADYIQELKSRNQDYRVKISIVGESVFKKYNSVFKKVSFYPFNKSRKIRDLIIKHSYHSEKPINWYSIDYSSNVVIEISEKNPIYISVDPTGFSFDSNQGLTGFSNPELADYLTDTFKKAGLPEISKIFKNNKYLYESYIEMESKIPEIIYPAKK